MGAEKRDVGGHVCVHVPEAHSGPWDAKPAAPQTERSGLLHRSAQREGEYWKHFSSGHSVSLFSLHEVQG